MGATISEELADLLRECVEAGEPGREVQVIVTTSPDADLSRLKTRGLKVRHVFEAISAVSGSLPASEVAALADLEQVQLLELDGEMHAA